MLFYPLIFAVLPVYILRDGEDFEGDAFLLDFFCRVAFIFVVANASFCYIRIRSICSNESIQ